MVSERAGRRIYFSASIRGGREDAPLYSRLIAALRDHGVVLTEHIGSRALSAGGEHGLSDAAIYERDVRWLEQADVILAEVTTPSLGVGYEIALGAQLGKPVVCLFRPESGSRLSAMVRGNPAVKILEYSSDDAPSDVASRAMKVVRSGSDSSRCRDSHTDRP